MPKHHSHSVARAMRALVLAIALTGCLDRELAEVSPCLYETVDETIETSGISQVDVLFVVDNSESMAEEQALLRAEFRRLVELLTSGRRPDGRTFDPVKNLHLGVVSTDMGAPQWVSGCNWPGDDGLLQIDPNPEGQPGLNCPAQVGAGLPFLTYEQGQDAGALVRDFQCIATLGTGGCGIEQQLEASLKALLPSQLPGHSSEALSTFLDPAGMRTFGHGDGANMGFLRGLSPNAQGVVAEDSLVAVVLVTDEEDCSVRDRALFDRSVGGERINMLCHDNADKLFAVSRYVDGLRALRPRHPERVIFAAIAGIPVGAAPDRSTVDLADADAVDAQFAQLLAHPDMAVTEVEHPTRPGVIVAKPVCKSATPARRIVEVARGFGRNGVVHSICEDDFGPAMDAVVDAIVDQLPNVCLPRPLIANIEGLVPGCRVFWDLPMQPGAGQLRDCSERGYLAQPADQPFGEDGRMRCEVQQVPVQQGAPMPGMGGWHYDDFSSDVRQDCGARDAGGRMRGGQRVAFSEPPGPGVRVELDCSQERSGGVFVDGLDDDGATIGTACADDDGLADDAICLTGHGRLFCHPQANRCVLACAGDADCPPAWVCDTRAEIVEGTGGRAVCVNPTCQN